jgi:hypothetical protein
MNFRVQQYRVGVFYVVDSSFEFFRVSSYAIDYELWQDSLLSSPVFMSLSFSCQVLLRDITVVNLDVIWVRREVML